MQPAAVPARAARANEAGYQNLGYSYRVFRRFTGTTPSAGLAAHKDAAVVPC
jgi:AraC-like DNA-binding protein